MPKLLSIALLLLVGKALAVDAESPNSEKRPTKIWNRTGPLGKTPKWITDAYPLSDQQNQGGWVKLRR